jgi:hypothetical protein
MRKLLPLLIGTLVLGAASAQAARPVDREAELARALEGRVAGDPVDCIDLHRVHGTRIIADTAIIYDAGGTLYVNRPRAGASSLNHWDALLTRLPTNQLCSVDAVQMINPSTRTMTGIVMLGDFVPYRRVRD